ncbi:MAG: preprotein translocase subunit SecE [Oscillatoriales cyanobacterium RM2_1_1]|nr:preprotein translocase subunit SecE [Oscillatoriales cyanobacterium SM2_3_0]NJO44734.1 preprotein translocase subunit SecE [Oscillatoriales cyanobacterium RM2_1_1]
MARKEEVKPQETLNKPNPIVSFLKESREEFAKIVWPSRQQLFSESAGVLLMVILSATIIYLVDNLFRWASAQVFQVIQ